MSGILITSGRPRPRRRTAVVEDVEPPPPKELPRINPLIPVTGTLTLVGVLYVTGVIQFGHYSQGIQIEKARPAAPERPRIAREEVKRAPRNIKVYAPSGEGPRLLQQVRVLAYQVGKEPTSQITFPERLATLRAYFALLTPVDREAVFGIPTFEEIETFLQGLPPEQAYETLDRLFVRIRLTLH